MVALGLLYDSDARSGWFRARSGGVVRVVSCGWFRAGGVRAGVFRAAVVALGGVRESAFHINF